MRCCYCRQNQATKTYEQMKNGKKSVEYYCLDCYHRLFFSAEEAGGETSLSACPYCGLTKTEFRSKKLVGCAYCYRTLTDEVMPTVIKMQGVVAHKGKRPPFDQDTESSTQGCDEPEYAQQAQKRARFKKQCHELETVIAKLLKDGDVSGAKEYQDKLLRMRKKAEVEEDFVWRKRPSLSKRS